MIGTQFNNGPAAKQRPFTTADADKFLGRGYQALTRRDYREAAGCCQLVLKYMPKLTGAHFLAGLIGIDNNDWSTAQKAFRTVVGLNGQHVAGWAQLARVFMQQGQYNNADTALGKAVDLGTDDPLVMDVIGTVYSLLGDQSEALVWFDRAFELSGNDVYQLSRAKSLTFLGRIKEARYALEAMTKAHPRAAQAHLMLARLEKAKDDKHIQQMKTLLSQESEASPNLAFWHYAIGKEQEDLHAWGEAFSHYEKGAAARRKQVSFDEKAEEELFKALSETFSAEWFKKSTVGSDEKSPIFIVGQPRTGTTLIERIVTAHSDVASAGELQQFAMCVKRLAETKSPQRMTPEIIREAAGLNLNELAELYMDTTKSVRPDSPYFVDKLPVNYMYVPLIAAAFPNAKIIHVVRDPMDSCFASYKQLFADAYYHSYDQEEMARHHLRYRNLMQQWRAVVGDRMLDVHYERTVQNTEENARRIIDFLGLDWQSACLDFHAQDSAVTTASAAQVREKAHSRSVGRWREFEEFLGPMKQVLENAGL